MPQQRYAASDATVRRLIVDAQAFDYGDRTGARYLAFVAPDEWDKGMVRSKNLRGASMGGAEDAAGEGDTQGEGGGKQFDVPWEGFQDAVSAMVSK